MKYQLPILALGLFMARGSVAQRSNQPRLIDALQLPFLTNAVATAPNGRIFLNMVRMDGSPGPRVVEWVDGKAIPYPSATWNEGATASNAANRLVLVNSLRLGPEGDLWLVDSGVPAFGKPRLPHGPKLVDIDPVTNEVKRVFDLDSYTNAKSFVDDVRFNGKTAYLSDAGSGAIIVLNLTTGTGRRVLENTAAVQATKPAMPDGKPLIGPNAKPVYVNADQMEVSPDGQWLYFQPLCGPLYRIETKWLEDSVPPPAMASHIEHFADTPSTGGTAMDASGNIYLSDIDGMRLLKITPNGSITEVLSDKRLTWIDAMWIDDQGYLWMPAAQLNRIDLFQGGHSGVHLPAHVYKVQIGERPPKSDHP